MSAPSLGASGRCSAQRSAVRSCGRAPLRYRGHRHLPSSGPCRRWACSSARSGTRGTSLQTGWWSALLTPSTCRSGRCTTTPTSSPGARTWPTPSSTASSSAIPATVIPITVAAFAAYAFAWMRFPFRGTLFLIVVGLLVVPLQMALIPVLQIYSALGISRAPSWASGWRTPASACRWRSSCSTTSSASCRATSSRRPASTAPRTSRCSRTSCCRCRSRPWRPSPSSSSCGSGTTCWWRSSSWVPQEDVAVATVELNQLVGNRGQAVAPADGGCVRDDDPAAAGVPGPAALLRARHPLRLRQGLSVGNPRRPEDDVLGQLLPAFEGTEPPTWLLQRVSAGQAHGVTVFLRANARDAGEPRPPRRAAPGRRHRTACRCSSGPTRRAASWWAWATRRPASQAPWPSGRPMTWR